MVFLSKALTWKQRNMSIQVQTHKLRMIYLNYMNTPETIMSFALRLSISGIEARQLLAAGAVAHNNVLEIEKDGRYKVVHQFMGAGMHNYRIKFEDEYIGYALNEEEGWALAHEHHIARISQSVNYYKL